MMQFYHAFTVAGRSMPAFGATRNNWILMAGTATAFKVHLLAMYTP